MNLEEFFNKQKNHWDMLFKASPLLNNVTYDERNNKLFIYASVSTIDTSFHQNCIFNLNNHEIENKIADYACVHKPITLSIMVTYPKGNRVVITYTVLQGLTSDYNEDELRNYSNMIVICARPSISECYKKDNIPMNSDDKLNKVSKYLTDIYNSFNNYLKKSKDGVSFNINVSTDDNGDVVIKHSCDNDEPVYKRFENDNKTTKEDVSKKEDTLNDLKSLLNKLADTDKNPKFLSKSCQNYVKNNTLDKLLESFKDILSDIDVD